MVVTMELEAYRFDRATNALYHFFWHEYCDWYLELIKPVLQDTMHPQGSATRRMLQETLEVYFATSSSFHALYFRRNLANLASHGGETIVIQPYPVTQTDWHDSVLRRKLFIFLSKALACSEPPASC